jgi:hypothetical protein
MGGNGYADVTWNPTVNEGGLHVEACIVRASKGAEMRVSNEEFWKNVYVIWLDFEAAAVVVIEF